MNQLQLPHDVRGLIPFFDWWLWVGLPVALVAALVALAIWWQKRQGRQKPIPEVTPQEPQVVILRRQWRQLSVPGDFSRPEQIQFFYELSRILRAYVEDVLTMPASDRTVPELEVVWRADARLDEALVSEMLALLRRSDFIKFADRKSSTDEAHAALAAVGTMLDQLDALMAASQQPDPDLSETPTPDRAAVIDQTATSEDVTS